ncbi:tetratricopeptide repeat protein [Ekhidna sp.]
MSDKKKLIDEYFDASTSVSRKDEIEKELSNLTESNPDRVLLELGKTIQLDDEVEDFRRRMSIIGEPEKKSKSFLLKIAASLLLVVSVMAILIKVLPESSSNQAIFQRHYTPYDGVVIARSDAPIINKGILAYLEGDFEVALDELIQVEEPTGQFRLVISNCHLSLGNWDQALAILNQINDAESQMIQDNRDWYLAITYLRTDQIEKSYNLLKSLKERNTDFMEKVEDLLRESLFKEIEESEKNY